MQMIMGESLKVVWVNFLTLGSMTSRILTSQTLTSHLLSLTLDKATSCLPTNIKPDEPR
jgi:hypothetical protein